MIKRYNPVKTKAIESRYNRQLTAIARHINNIFHAFEWNEVDNSSTIGLITKILEGYSDQLLPWANAAASRMIQDVDRQAESAWLRHSNEMSAHIRNEIRNTAAGQAFRDALERQVGLIQSIPLEAARRVHELTLRGIEGGIRSSDMVDEIMRSGEIARSRAILIARTEVARTSSLFTEARSRNAGSTHYIWRTAHDTDVRSSHADMEGKIVAWDNPPSFPDGHSYHAGCIWNCRCWSESIFPD